MLTLEAPLEHFHFNSLDIRAATAGHIVDAKDRSFAQTTLITADGSVVALTNDQAIRGIPSREVKATTAERDASTPSFAEQDKH